MPGRRAGYRLGPLIGLCALASAYAGPAGSEEPIVLSLGKLEPGKVFECTIRAEIRHGGTKPLAQFRAIARAYSGSRVLASSGVATGDRPLVRENIGNGDAYTKVPLQFEFTSETCGNMTAVGIVFARCRFGDEPAVDCLNRVRVEGPSDSKIEYFVEKGG